MQEEISIKKIRFQFLLIVLMIGFCHAISTRNSVDPDGVSYLDVGDAYFHLGFQNAVNSYWSPLYSWMQGLFLFLFKVTPSSEPLAVHIVNLIIFLLSYAAFIFFLNGFIEVQKEKHDSFPEWVWVVLGNCLFIWSSTNMITISILTPDMCVAGIIYFIISLLVSPFSNFYSQIILLQ